MNTERTALIVEGGGLRGVYASGVLRFFMDRHFYPPYVIGVSNGACNCANYVSRQPERNRSDPTQRLSEETVNVHADYRVML